MAVTPSTAAKMQRLALGQLPGRQRPGAGARHLLIDAPVEDVIDGGGAGRGQRDAEIAPQQRIQRRQAGAGQQRADDGGEGDERDDLGLGQLEVAPPERPGARREFGGRRHVRKSRSGMLRVRSLADRRWCRAIRRREARGAAFSARLRSAAAPASPAAAAPHPRCARWPATAESPCSTMVMPMRSCRARAASSARARARALLGSPRRRSAKSAAPAERHGAHERAEAVGEVDGDARRVVEHAALVVDALAAPQHEGVAVVGMRPPGCPDRSENPGRRSRRSCCWSSHRARSARRAPASPSSASPQAVAMGEAPPPEIERPALCSAVVPQLAPGEREREPPQQPQGGQPNSRCSVTISGFSCQVTVSMPRIACSSTVAHSDERERHAHQAQPAHADGECGDDEDHQHECAGGVAVRPSRARPCRPASPACSAVRCE